MKCPKCGSDLDTGFNCTKCDYKHNQKRLSTAEKLMWLVENGYMTLNPTLKYGHKAMREIERHMQSTIFDSFDEEIDKYYGLSKEQK